MPISIWHLILSDTIWFVPYRTVTFSTHIMYPKVCFRTRKRKTKNWWTCRISNRSRWRWWREDNRGWSRFWSDHERSRWIWSSWIWSSWIWSRWTEPMSKKGKSNEENSDLFVAWQLKMLSCFGLLNYSLCWTFIQIVNKALLLNLYFIDPEHFLRWFK